MIGLHNHSPFATLWQQDFPSGTNFEVLENVSAFQACATWSIKVDCSGGSKMFAHNELIKPNLPMSLKFLLQVMLRNFGLGATQATEEETPLEIWPPMTVHRFRANCMLSALLREVCR